MTVFASAPAYPRAAPLDPTKHVNYTLGMVLGADDFDQEFAYLSGRDRWLARDLHGYGTVWGLHLAVETEDRGPRVNVAPGVAVTPCGQLVCVTPAQCAYLVDWLAAHEEEVGKLVGSPPGATSPPGIDVPLYVVLCYRDCATDDVPIPGEPCRTEDTLTAPSRLKDDFRLELRLDPPYQPEEDAVRDFVDWLRQVPVVAGPGSTIAELQQAIRDAAAAAIHELESPPSSPPGSPPHGTLDLLAGPPPLSLAIPHAHEREYLRAAFDVWVTELRPALRHALPGCECGCGGGGACGCGCDGSTGTAGEPCDEDVVLLGTIDMFVLLDEGGGGLVVESAAVADDQSRRPYLLHTRMLQEWMLAGGMPLAEGSPPLMSSPPQGINEVHVKVLAPGSDPQVVSFSNGVLTLGLSTGKPGDPGAGIANVVVNGLPEGSPPTAALANGTLTLGIPAGAKGDAGQGITNVVVNGLPAGSPPTAALANGTLTLGIPAGAPGAPGGSNIIGAGRFGPQGGAQWATGDLSAKRIVGATVAGLYYLTNEYLQEKGTTGNYAVVGSILTAPADQSHTFEVVPADDNLKAALAPLGPGAAEFDPAKGLFVRAVGMDRKGLSSGFIVQISDLTGMP